MSLVILKNEICLKCIDMRALASALWYKMCTKDLLTIMAAYILTNKKKSTLCKHVPCNTLTHSTNEDLLNIKRKGDPEVSYPLSYVRYH